MGVTTTYMPSGATIYDYTGQVDFRISPRGSWRVWTLIKLKDDEQLMHDLMARKLGEWYRMDVHAISSNTRIMLEFGMKETCTDIPVARRDLLRFLTVRKLPIIWKEGKHGYEIDRSGRIHRKWRLNTQYTVPARDIDA